MKKATFKNSLRNFAPVFLILPVLVSAQIRYDFENRDLSCWFMQADSAWDASAQSPVTGEYSLKHVRDNPQSGSDMICLPIDSLRPEQGTTRWQFALKHGYDPSQANRWAVYLVSDHTSLTYDEFSEISAIAITLDHNTSDDIVRLLRIDKGDVFEIINTGINWQEQAGIYEPLFFNVERSREGEWMMTMKMISSSEPVVIFTGKGSDSWLPEIQSFCIFYEYSSRQDQKLWFDDLCIDGTFMNDTTPPFIRKVEVTSGHELLVTFSESIVDEQVHASVVSPGSVQQVADSIGIVSDSSLYISFLSDFTSGSYSSIIIENACDRKGNIAALLQTDFFYRHAEKYDVVINEIMYDPEPVNGLPGYEYVELFNRSGYEISTAGWVFSTEGRGWVLGPWHIPPEGYLLLTSSEAMALFGMSDCIKSLFTSSACLSNQGGLLQLSDQYGDIISFVLYDPAWHTDEYKKNGGWALEKIDPGNFCGRAENWRSSVSLLGGTPCFVNSVRSDNPDRASPMVSNIYCPDNLNLEIGFSESIDPDRVQDKTCYSVNHGAGSPDSIIVMKADYSVVRLVYDHPFRQRIVYELTTDKRLTDCCGNVLQLNGNEHFALSEPVVAGDILISELLFNPLPGGVDYLELFNNCEKVIDLADLMLGTRDRASGRLDVTGTVSDKHYLFYPGEYVALSTSPEIVRSMYYVRDPSRLIRTSLPSLGDKEGNVVLLNKWFEVIDELNYSEDMHFALLDSREGISLERISFKGMTNDPNNWHSAAETAGFGTPGYENSQSLNEVTADRIIHVDPQTFTPDNDGNEDMMCLTWTFDKPGNVITASIFDPRGRRVRKLAANVLAGTQGFLTWDGLTDDQRLAGSGIYLLVVEVFDKSGNRSMYKESCVLARRYR